jgi:hypothetical protein
LDTVISTPDLLESRLSLEGYQDLFINGEPILTTEAKHTVEYRIEVLRKVVFGDTEKEKRLAKTAQELRDLFQIEAAGFEPSPPNFTT